MESLYQRYTNLKTWIDLLKKSGHSKKEIDENIYVQESKRAIRKRYQNYNRPEGPILRSEIYCSDCDGYIECGEADGTWYNGIEDFIEYHTIHLPNSQYDCSGLIFTMSLYAAYLANGNIYYRSVICYDV